MRNASAAEIGAPVSNAYMAFCRPITRGSRCVAPPPGTKPTLTSGCAKRAPAEAMTKSHCRTSSLPPPKASPLTAAITGLGERQMACVVKVLMAPTTSRPACSRRSAPTAKTSSPPVSTIALTASSSVISLTWRSIRRRTSVVSAFLASGLLRRITATPGRGCSSNTTDMSSSLEMSASGPWRMPWSRGLGIDRW